MGSRQPAVRGQHRPQQRVRAGDWRRFFANVGTLPLDSSSTFIRSMFNGMGFHRNTGSAMRAHQMLASMLEQVQLFNDGRLASYYDVVRTSR